MFLEFLQSSGSIAGIFAGIALFFWIVVTMMVRRVNKGELKQSATEEEAELEAMIDKEVEAIRQASGKKIHPPITE